MTRSAQTGDRHRIALGTATLILLAPITVASAEPATASRIVVASPVRVEGLKAAPAWPTALITALATLFAGGAAAWIATRNARATIVQGTNQRELDAIASWLDGFLGPFLQLSEENRLLIEALRGDHGGSSFRTLTALLDPKWLPSLSSGDRKLVEAIVENGVSLRRLILEKAGAPSRPLVPELAKASLHFRMLEMAHGGGLDRDPARYADYVYPRKLDALLESERVRLESRLRSLRQMPEKRHLPMAEMVIKDELENRSVPRPDT